MGRKRNTQDRAEAWFWANVTKGSNDECWEWTKARAHGYGITRFRGATVKAHRVAYMLCIGEIPEDQPCILHSCDNPACVNPAHLRAGTKKANTSDMMRRGRNGHGPVVGEQNPNAKLTARAVLTMRAKHVQGQTQTSLAYEYGVSVAAGGQAIRGYTWKQL